MPKRAKDKPRPQVLKPQPTVKGFYAWVIERMEVATGDSPAEAAAWIIRAWIDNNQDFLRTSYGIRREDFTGVISLADRRDAKESEVGQNHTH